VTHILVADDDPSMRQLLLRALTRRGYDVWCAANAEEIFRAIDQKKPDLLLLDSMMPDAPGLEVLRKLKASPETSPIPVVMLTGRDDPGYKEEVLASGASDFLLKPCPPSELADHIRQTVPGNPDPP
jgi:two-component system, OmpR family, phosphate regulon response regulator PhoB